MRIAVYHDPPPGGARRAIAEMVRRLARRHEVHVYLLGNTDEASAAEEVYGAPVIMTPFRARRHRRLAPYWNDLLTYRDLQDGMRLERAIAARIDADGCDAALISVLRYGQAPSVLRWLHTPTVYYCHEPLRRFYEPWCRPEAGPMSRWERGRRLWRRPAQTLLDRLIHRRDLAHVRQADLVLTNSHYSVRRIRAVYGRDADVCYLGVDTGRWRPAASPGECPAGEAGYRSSVLSVGALEAHKGFDFIIRALGRIPSPHQPALTIVGGSGHPAMPAYLHRLAQEAGVALHIRSGLTDAELLAAYQASALFVFGARYEPFGLVALEAMACGLPVVAVAEGGLPEIVRDGHSGHLVPREEGAFASAVQEVLLDDARRQALGQAARAEAATWTWDAAAARLEDYLRRTARLPEEQHHSLRRRSPAHLPASSLAETPAIP